MGYRALLILEVMALFGPAVGVLVFYGPLSLIGLVFSPSLDSALVSAIAGLGFVGLIAVLHLASHAIDSTHKLPKKPTLIVSVASGCVACLAAAWFFGKDTLGVALLLAPIIGMAHLLYRALGHADRVGV